MLHTINKSPFEKNSLESCLRLAKPGDHILLIEDAVYAATPDTIVSDKIQAAVKKHSVFALGPDLASRGIEESRLLEGIEVVDYSGFVDLTVRNDKVQSWL